MSIPFFSCVIGRQPARRGRGWVWLALASSLGAVGCHLPSAEERVHQKFAEHNEVVFHWARPEDGRRYALVRQGGGNILGVYALMRGPEDGTRYIDYHSVAVVKSDGTCAQTYDVDGSYWRKDNVRGRSGKTYEVHRMQHAREERQLSQDCVARYGETAAWPTIESFFAEHGVEAEVSGATDEP